jgi:hypothetical protein
MLICPLESLENAVALAGVAGSVIHLPKVELSIKVK